MKSTITVLTIVILLLTNIASGAFWEIDVTGIPSMDAIDDPDNIVLTTNLGYGAVITGIGWYNTIGTIGTSWRSEARTYYNIGGDGFFVTEGSSDNSPGTNFYSSGGIIDLVAAGLKYFTNLAGDISIQFYEGYDDYPGAADAYFLNGTITLEYFNIPKPPLLFEDFETWPPAGWTIVNHGGDCVWDSTANTGRPNNTGGTGDAADADSDACGSGTTMDTSLISPAFSLDGAFSPELEFKSDFQDLAASDDGYVDITTNGGAAWHTILHFDKVDVPGPFTTNLPLGAFTGQSNVQVRFHYVAPGWDWYWVVDDVKVFENLPSVDLEPVEQTGEGYPGSSVNYSLEIFNDTWTNQSFDLSYTSIWPISGPANSGELAHGASTSITVSVQVPADALAGQVDTSIVMATGVADSSFEATATIITRCTWQKGIFETGFDDNPFDNGWVQYNLGAPTGWVWYTVFGNPAPCMKHWTIAQPCTNWLVGPSINLSGDYEKVNLMFEEYYYNIDTNLHPYSYAGLWVSTDQPDPEMGTYTELQEFGSHYGSWVGSGWNIDVSPFKDDTNVYFAFVYIGNDAANHYLDNINLQAAKIGIDNATLSSPSTINIGCYSNTPDITAALYISGETGSAGPASNITGQIGYGLRGTSPEAGWTWIEAQYSYSDAVNDYFVTNMPVTVSGDFDYACRFKKGDAEWVYGDLTGSTNGYDSADAGKMTVTMCPPIGSLVYEQTLADVIINAFPSQIYPDTVPPAQMITADDLRPDANTTINSIRWKGVYWNAGRQGTEGGILISFFASEQSNALVGFEHPGSLIYTQYVAGYACEMLTTNDPTFGLNVYKYHVNLTTPFQMSYTSTYWFSAQMVLQEGTTWGPTVTPDPVRGLPAEIASSNDWFALDSDIGLELYGEYINAGFLEGFVTANHSGENLEGAIVTATDGTSVWSDTTISNGYYSMILPAGDYNVTAFMQNYASQTVVSVPIIRTTTTVLDFSLLGSQLDYSPTGIVENMGPYDVVTNTVTVTNSGPLDVNYSINFGNFSAQATMMMSSEFHLPAFEGKIEHTEPLFGKISKSVAGVPVPPQNNSAKLASGSLCYGFDIYPANNLLVSFDSGSPGTLNDIGNATASGSFIAGADFLNDDFSKLYAITYGANELVSVNVANASTSFIGSPTPGTGENWTGLSGSPEGTLYASSIASQSYLYTINPSDGTATYVGQIGSGLAIIGIAVNSSGNLYGLDIAGDNLVQINKATGAATTIGSVGFDAGYAQGMDFDDSSDTLYLAAYNVTANQGQLRIADTATGNSTSVGLLGDGAREIDGLAIAASAKPDWISASTNAGTIAAGNIGTFGIIFDANMVTNDGTYSGELTFSGTFVNDVLPMPLAMIVETPPVAVISVDPLSFDFGQIDMDTVTQTIFSVENIGTGPLSVNVSITNCAPMPGWLTPNWDFAIIATGNVDYLEVTADTTGYSEGTYTCDVLFASNDPQNPEIYAPVSIEIIPEPVFIFLLAWFSGTLVFLKKRL